jgi:hypothetical protein
MGDVPSGLSLTPPRETKKKLASDGETRLGVLGRRLVTANCELSTVVGRDKPPWLAAVTWRRLVNAVTKHRLAKT